MSNIPASSLPDENDDEPPSSGHPQARLSTASELPGINAASANDGSSSCDSVRSDVDLSVELSVDLTVDHEFPCPVPPIDRIRRAVVLAASDQGCRCGQIGLRLCSDASIHEINRTHLGHDYPTDVISFGYELAPPSVEGELIVSGDTAIQKAGELVAATSGQWTVEDELLLYIIHGVLHIAGMDDHDAADREAMRQAEQRVLDRLGVAARPYVESSL